MQKFGDAHYGFLWAAGRPYFGARGIHRRFSNFRRSATDGELPEAKLSIGLFRRTCRRSLPAVGVAGGNPRSWKVNGAVTVIGPADFPTLAFWMLRRLKDSLELVAPVCRKKNAEGRPESISGHPHWWWVLVRDACVYVKTATSYARANEVIATAFQESCLWILAFG